ncbi:hypothetical protein HY58_02405 [Flavihumibacter sp. ZG627]|nr:hypothetical protein HY58_02405 [Flavihumibacter sp. ZG627]
MVSCFATTFAAFLIIATSFIANKVSAQSFDHSVSNKVAASAFTTGGMSFKALLKQGFVSLQWNAAANDSIQEVTIEKSLDGILFHTVSVVDQSISTNISEPSAYNDDLIADKMNPVFYRLRVKHQNGRETISSVKKIDPQSAPQMIMISIPAQVTGDSLQFSIPDNWVDKKVVIEIYNNAGELVRRITEPQAMQIIDVEMFDLAAGTYLIRTGCEKQLAVNYVVNPAKL